LEEVLAAEQTDQARVMRQHAEQVARAEYEARLAQKQYDAVDPDNRLVAAELERRWEQALQTLGAAREAAQQAAATRTPPPTLDPALREQLRDLGPRMPEMWASGRLRAVHKKELLRSLIRRVILTRPVADVVEVKIVWVSGAISLLTLRPPIWRTADLGGYEQLLARVRELSQLGYSDREVAQRLNEEGFHAARREEIDETVVRKLRRREGLVSLRQHYRQEAKLDGQWTVHGLSRELGVKRGWLYRRIVAGQIPAVRQPVSGHYLIPDDPALIAVLRVEVSRQQRVLHVESAAEGGE
jgi:hypothetical protein